MRKKTNLLLTLFALLALPTAANAQIVIDDFNSGNSLSQFVPGTSSSQTSTGADILGGQRIDTLTVPAVANSFNGILGFDGNLAIGQGSSDEIVANLLYDTLAVFDLTDGGTLDAFALDFRVTDSLLPIDNVLELTATSAGATASQFVTIPGNGSLTAPVLVEFSDFVGVDFRTVDSLALDFDFAANPGRDLEVGSFSAVSTAVPEPGSLILLPIASLVALRRRRK